MLVRFFGFLVGLLFIMALLVAALMPREAATPDPTKALLKPLKEAHWQQDDSFGLGILGTYDRAQLQRGYQVYKDVCAACHSLELVHFRDLEKIGFSEAQVKALAKEAQIPTIDPDSGDETTRPGLPSDPLPSPFANPQAAAASLGAAPPDLSLMDKARKGGKRYIYSLLTGYGQEVPLGHEVPDNLHFNPYFPALNIAMPAPLSDDQVTYADGTPATVDQMAQDVAAFLEWAAEPNLEVRRQIGVGTAAFLIILTVLVFLSNQRIWARAKEHPEEVGDTIV